MAPTRTNQKEREPSIERTSEYEEFLEKLAAYHEKRGTYLERKPKIGTRHLDLLKLYKRVVAEGGYDKVSDTKTNKLAWRRLAGEFLPGSSNLTTQAFLVKSAYYKNLAAYEISTVHNREPPPKEILEDVSAKGGDLLNRTVENYFRPVSREAERLANGDDRSGESDSEDDTRTPKGERMDTDEPGSTGRPTRTLRHAPPQRVLFQPDISAPRQTRQSTGAMQSPSANGAYGSGGAADAIANYVPSTAVPSSMKPVVTPATNPDYFLNLKKKFIIPRTRGQPIKGMMLPGTGYPGPSIYIRALHALQSGVPQEETYALHHMVKISHERGDKYRFDQFPGLAEALMAKVIQVASLFYEVNWDISYVEENIEKGGNYLNGISGTKDLLERIQGLKKIDIQDDLLPKNVSEALSLVNEAGLVLRNMVMLNENALYISTMPIIRDLIVIVLNLPSRATVVELQHYVLEIAEQLTRFWILDTKDPLYISLLAQLDTEDRGKIVTALKTIGRISMHLESSNRLSDVPPKVLRSICDWLLVEDEELRNACLDFLYLYTNRMDNVETLVNEINVEGLVSQLTRLLMYNCVVAEEKKTQPKIPKPSQFSDTPPKLSSSIIEQLVALDEPDRSSQWLRTCFEEDPHGEITQIALWSAYNAAFADMMVPGNPFKQLMPAKDFITNVSSTFAGASAQVLQINPTQQKYTIRGIRPRAVPADPITKKPYMRCQWHPPIQVNGHTDMKHSAASPDCGEYAPGAKAMWEHIVSVHLRVPRDESGRWVLEQKPDINMTNGDSASVSAPARYFCHWGGCKKFNPSGTESAFEVGQHVKTHLPDTTPLHGLHAKHNHTPSNLVWTPHAAKTRAGEPKPKSFGAPFGLGGLGMGNSRPATSTNGGTDETTTLKPPVPRIAYLNTMVDERGDAAGLPLSSALVLRNLARQMKQLDPPSALSLSAPSSPRVNNNTSNSNSNSSNSNNTTNSKRRHDDIEDEIDQHGGHHPRAGKKPRSEGADKEVEREMQRDDESGWVTRVFAPVKEQLYFVAAHNWALREYVQSLLQAVAAGGG